MALFSMTADEMTAIAGSVSFFVLMERVSQRTRKGHDPLSWENPVLSTVYR